MKRTSRELLDAFDDALAEVSRRAEANALEGSGRFYSDEELERGAATGGLRKPEKGTEAPAA